MRSAPCSATSPAPACSRPRPRPPDRAVGQITGGWDRSAAARCVASAREAERVRWSQYRAVWGYVEGDGCRRRALLDAFR